LLIEPVMQVIEPASVQYAVEHQIVSLPRVMKMEILLEQTANKGCLRRQLPGTCEQLPDKNFTVGGFA
jgi:hypothetical protein